VILAGGPTPEVPGAGQAAAGGDVQAGGSAWGMILAVFMRNRLAIAGVGIVVFMVLFSFLGPVFYHTNQVQTQVAEINLPPSSAHPLGTDEVG